MHVLLHMYQLAQMPNFKLWKSHHHAGTKTRSSKKKLITFRRPTNEKYRKSIRYQGLNYGTVFPVTYKNLICIMNSNVNLRNYLNPRNKSAEIKNYFGRKSKSSSPETQAQTQA